MSVGAPMSEMGVRVMRGFSGKPRAVCRGAVIEGSSKRHATPQHCLLHQPQE
jgi:hypothetical protein